MVESILLFSIVLHHSQRFFRLESNFIQEYDFFSYIYKFISNPFIYNEYPYIYVKVIIIILIILEICTTKKVATVL